MRSGVAFLRLGILAYIGLLTLGAETRMWRSLPPLTAICILAITLKDRELHTATI